jgi:hypothetical protein
MAAQSLISSFQKKVSISLIGTAGRRDDLEKLNVEIYNRAIDKVKEVIVKHFKLSLEDVHLISGGAAWIDHIAVALFLLCEVPQLTLHFPAPFITDEDNPHFLDTGKDNWKTNPGRLANSCHQNFSAKIKDDSLKQINSAILMGASYTVHRGFHERNTMVAKSPYLIALTWGDGSTPKKGGTLDTWNKCPSTTRRIHVSLQSLTTSSCISTICQHSTFSGSRKRQQSSDDLKKSEKKKMFHYSS